MYTRSPVRVQPDVPILRIEPGVAVRDHLCRHCGQAFRRTTGFIHRHDRIQAVYHALCHADDGAEVWIDVIFGTWLKDEGIENYEPGTHDVNDHVTFGCRVGIVGEDGSEQAATLVDGASKLGKSNFFGRILTREVAATHPALPAFWRIIDHILIYDQVVHSHMQGTPRPHD